MSQSITEIRNEIKKMQKLVKAGYAYADKLYQKARDERDAEGYRECLGYDQRNKLEEKISPLKSENYSEYCNILDHFNRLCDSL